MKKSVILHPFLFAIFPILFLYSHNKEQLYFGEILLPSAIVLGITFLLLLLFNIGLRDAQKAGIAASLFLILFFSHGHIFNMSNISFIDTIDKHLFLIQIEGILFASSVYFILRIKRSFHNFTKILNIIAFFLVLIPSINIALYEFKTRNLMKYDNYKIDDKIINISENVAMNRDIYYIILDGYVSYSTLKEIYGYDNHEFYDYLIKKGFYIANESCSNYAWTRLSLASSLNMEYIDDVSKLLGVESNDKKLLYRMIKDNRVINFLRSRGYKFIHFSSSWGGGATSHNRYADIDNQSDSNLSEFQILLIQTTILSIFDDYWKDIFREEILTVFRKLAEVYKLKGKKFVFAHIILPHPPFLFDENGKKLPGIKLSKDQNDWKLKERYLKQLIFTNRKVKVLIGQILSQSEINPIIILQADHGSGSSFGDFSSIDWVNPSEGMLKERMRIFNAYNLPPDGNGLLYDSVTPVNTFRIIFNHYFGTNYELLDDRSYFSSPHFLLKLTEVTTKVTYD